MTGPSMSLAKKLTIAAFLAVAVSAASPQATEASTITCGFGGASDGEGDECGGVGDNFAVFDFGDYELTLHFEGTILRPFQVGFENQLTNQYELEGGGTSSEDVSRLPAGARCVPIAGLGPGDNCVVFHQTEPVPVQGEDFTGNYRIDIIWLAATDSEYPGLTGLVRLLHDSSLSPGNFFGDDITIEGSYFVVPTCEICFPVEDPGIGGRDNNFGDFTVVFTPEPATLILVGSGIAGALYRRRRQRRQN